MKLDSVHLQNYRCHKDLKVDFVPGFNVVVGINGSGKTSLLNGVCDALAGFTSHLRLTHGNHRAVSDADIRVEAERYGGALRFEPRFPVKVTAAGIAFDVGCVWTWTRTSHLSDPTLSGAWPGATWRTIEQATGPGAEERRANAHLPLVAFYRAFRFWNGVQPHEIQAATERHSRLDGYKRWWDASLDAASLQTWAIAKSLERIQTSSETGTPFDEIRDDELGLVNSALAAAVENAKGLRYDVKQKSLMVDWESSIDGMPRSTQFGNLSDGQRAVIGLVCDIARRMCLLNPQLGINVTAQTPGVVLIDELDIHLHPKWQRIITRGLKSAFPSLQFITASHSPQVLGELKPEEIILLTPEGTSHPRVSYGVDSNRVLEELMGATIRTPKVEQALSDLFLALERNELEAARQGLKSLSQLAPGLAELDGAAALLKRKEVLGR